MEKSNNTSAARQNKQQTIHLPLNNLQLDSQSSNQCNFFLAYPTLYTFGILINSIWDFFSLFSLWKCNFFYVFDVLRLCFNKTMMFIAPYWLLYNKIAFQTSLSHHFFFTCRRLSNAHHFFFWIEN